MEWRVCASFYATLKPFLCRSQRIIPAKLVDNWFYTFLNDTTNVETVMRWTKSKWILQAKYWHLRTTLLRWISFPNWNWVGKPWSRRNTTSDVNRPLGIKCFPQVRKRSSISLVPTRSDAGSSIVSSTHGMKYPVSLGISEIISKPCISVRKSPEEKICSSNSKVSSISCSKLHVLWGS